MIHVSPITLEGNGVRLEPMTVAHVEPLEAAAADGNLWELWFTTVPAQGQTQTYVEDALAGQAEGHRSTSVSSPSARSRRSARRRAA